MSSTQTNSYHVRLRTVLGIAFCFALTSETGSATVLRQYMNILPPMKEVDPARTPRLSMVVSQPRYFYCVLYPWSVVVSPVYCMRQYRKYQEYLRRRGPSTVKPDDLGYDPGLIDPRAASVSFGLPGGQPSAAGGQAGSV
ncbi:uncharacterized protein LOC144114091 [Amblyomma americanum]